MVIPLGSQNLNGFFLPLCYLDCLYQKKFPYSLYDFTIYLDFILLYKASRAELDKTIGELKIQLSETEGGKDKDLMELTEKAFVYSTYALVALENGSKQNKKEVFKGLGLNRTITDKILNVRANDWYSEIRKGYYSIREIMGEHEPEIGFKQKTIKDFDGLRLLLRGRWDSNPRPSP